MRGGLGHFLPVNIQHYSVLLSKWRVQFNRAVIPSQQHCLSGERLRQGKGKRLVQLGGKERADQKQKQCEEGRRGDEGVVWCVYGGASLKTPWLVDILWRGWKP